MKILTLKQELKTILMRMGGISISLVMRLIAMELIISGIVVIHAMKGNMPEDSCIWNLAQVGSSLSNQHMVFFIKSKFGLGELEGITEVENSSKGSKFSLATFS